MKKYGKKWLYNKAVIITGASDGIGKELSIELANKYNCKIIGIGRNTEKLQTVKELLKDNFTFYAFDVGNKNNWTDFANKTEQFKIDVLINCAGIMPPFTTFEKYSDEDIEKTINTNLYSSIYSVKALFKNICKSDTPAIINIASAGGICPVVGQSLYCLTKFALRGFTETLKEDYKNKIFVAGIYPGFVKTDIMRYQKTDTKSNKLINKMSASVEKTVNKIIKCLKKCKSRIILGLDGNSMNLFYNLMPNKTPDIIRAVLKKSKQKLFSDVFLDE